MKYVFYEICNTVHNLADCIGITTTSFSSSAVGVLQSQNVIDLSNHFVQKLCMFDYYCQNEKIYNLVLSWALILKMKCKALFFAKLQTTLEFYQHDELYIVDTTYYILVLIGTIKFHTQFTANAVTLLVRVSFKQADWSRKIKYIMFCADR